MSATRLRLGRVGVDARSSFSRHFLPTFATAALLAAGAACGGPPSPVVASPAASASAPLPVASVSSLPASTPVAARELRLLYTSDEHGWIAPFADKGRRQDGVAGLIARYRAEGLCVPAKPGDCDDVPVLALSGGDQWTGPAISSFFRGEPTTELWKRLGFSASALGNHELDFGRATFLVNQRAEGYPYLAANVTPAFADGGVAEPYRLFKRAGITLGVVGLSMQSTPIHGLRANYDGLVFGEEEAALAKTIPSVWKQGADAVIVIAHVCGDVLAPIVERHPEWRLSFVGAGHCHRLANRTAGQTLIVDPGSFLKSYVRVTVPVDTSLPVETRPIGARFEVVDLTYPETDSPPVPLDAAAAAIVADWQKKVDAALGQVVGHTNQSLDPDSPAMTNLITDAWRAKTKADAAILNRHGTRQSIPIGPVTKQTIYSVMPFDNHLVTMHVSGEALLENLACCNAHVSGVIRNRGGWRFSNGKQIDRKKTYTVVTTDYSYTGGGFAWERADPKAETTVDWREPVLDWLVAHPTTAAKGLETIIDAAPRVATKAAGGKTPPTTTHP